MPTVILRGPADFGLDKENHPEWVLPHDRTFRRDEPVEVADDVAAYLEGTGFFEVIRSAPEAETEIDTTTMGA